MAYICYQGNDKDCGFAALRMLLADKAKNKSYLFIKKPTKKKGYTFQDLERIAKGYGFVLLGFEMLPEDFRNIPKGSIVMLDSKHTIYIKKVGKRRVCYYDPEVGKTSIPNEEFRRRWDGKVLECTNATKAKKLKLKPEKMMPLWMSIVHYAMIAVLFMSLMAGFYLIKDNTNIIFTMVFLSIFAVTELVENWYILKELKYFDSRYLSRFFSHKSNQSIERYRYYTEYKSKYFIVAKLLVSNMIMISVFSVLLCINDYRNVFVFIILLLVKMIDNILFSKKEKDRIHKIEGIESVAFLDETVIEHSLTRANSLAGDAALGLSIKKVIYMFLCVCLSLGMMILSGVVSTNFLIFHFGIYFLMSEALENVVTFFSTASERKSKKAKFLDSCDL